MSPSCKGCWGRCLQCTTALLWMAVWVVMLQVWCSSNSADRGDTSLASVQWTMAERSFPLFGRAGHAALQVAVHLVSPSWTVHLNTASFSWTAFDQLSVVFISLRSRWRIHLTCHSSRCQHSPRVLCRHHLQSVLICRRTHATLHRASERETATSVIHMTSSPIHRCMQTCCTAASDDWVFCWPCVVQSRNVVISGCGVWFACWRHCCCWVSTPQTVHVRLCHRHHSVLLVEYLHLEESCISEVSLGLHYSGLVLVLIVISYKASVKEA